MQEINFQVTRYDKQIIWNTGIHVSLENMCMYLFFNNINLYFPKYLDLENMKFYCFKKCSYTLNIALDRIE